MNVAMGVPLKVATATSNMMIGITATSSAVIYLLAGEIDPYLAGPVALGVFLGASVGSRAAGRVDVAVLRWLFVIVVLVHRVRHGAPRPGDLMSAPAAARHTAFVIESLVARILVAGTYLAIGLILVGVIGMLATGVDPLDGLRGSGSTSPPFPRSSSRGSPWGSCGPGSSW